MEAIFSPEDDSPPPTMEQTITIPPSVVKDTLVITKTVIEKPKERDLQECSGQRPTCMSWRCSSPCPGPGLGPGPDPGPRHDLFPVTP